MKIYIPKHLRKIKLIDMLYNMIRNYEYTAETDSFSDYQYIMKTDPVRRFLNLIYVGEEDEKIEKINYLATLFYSVKGTYKVLDYITAFGILKDWENIDTTTQITYTVRTLSMTVESISVDKTLFCEYFEGFICALLYFKSIILDIGEIRAEVDGNAVTSINSGSFLFQYYEAKEEEQ